MCDGRTTAWDCLECRFGNSAASKVINLIPNKRISRNLSLTITKVPMISIVRGFRGMAIDTEDRKFFLSNILRRVDYIIAPSRALRDAFIESGITSPINVIHSGHDLSWLSYSSTYKKQSAKIRFGFIGQIIPIKGLHILLSAFESVRSDKAQLVVYGDESKDPEYMLKLRDMLKNYPSINVDFFGAFPYERLGEVLSEIDVLVVPSQWRENNPRVIQEAFASKTPVIASDVGGISEFVQQDINGLLFERDNIDELALASHIQKIIDEPKLLVKFEAGIPKVKTIEESLLEIEGIYHKLIAKNIKDPA